MSLLNPTIDALLLSLLLISLGWLYVYGQFHGIYKRASAASFFPAGVLLHSLYSVYNLTQRPPNLFKRLGIPMTLSTENIRALLLYEAGVGRGGGNEAGAMTVPVPMSDDLELLLSRLKTDESRAWFVRFGQRALQICAPCTSASDYILFVFAGSILVYVRTAAVLLLLTSNANGRARWRMLILGVLVCAVLAEGYAVVSMSAAPLPKDRIGVFMWHDNIYFARQMLIFILPIITQLLPASKQPGPPSTSLAPALARLERTLPRAHLLKYVRAAVMRRPELRERVERRWAQEKREGDAGREAESVQKVAEKMGFAFTDTDGGEVGKMRMGARRVVESLKKLSSAPVGR